MKRISFLSEDYKKRQGEDGIRKLAESLQMMHNGQYVMDLKTGVLKVYIHMIYINILKYTRGEQG